MALIKGKQIKDLDASKVVESASKKFATQAQLDKIATIDNKQDVLGFVPVDTAKVGVANGLAELDAAGKIKLSQLPDLTGNITSVVADMAALNAITEMKAGDQAVVLAGTSGKREAFIYDGSTWMLVSDADWANINIDYAAIVGAPALPSSTPSAIDAAVQKVGSKLGYSKTIIVPVAANQVTINTGIKTDGSGSNYTAYTDVAVSVNGFGQVAGAGKDFTVAAVANELVITWLNRNFALEADDEFAVTYTQLA